MKYKLLFLLLFLLIISQVSAQTPDPAIEKQFSRIVNLIKEDKVKKLSGLIAFPIKRDNPVPDIENKQEFIKYYPILFDQDFKLKLDTFKVSDIFQIGDNYGILNGALWMNAEGKIITVNYQSKSELSLAAKLTAEERSTLYPSIRQWQQNKYKCLTDKYMFRVDDTEKGYRLALWYYPSKWMDKPSLIMYNGMLEFSGKNAEYTFHAGSWTYLVEDIRISSADGLFGVLMTISKNGLEKRTSQCKCIK